MPLVTLSGHKTCHDQTKCVDEAASVSSRDKKPLKYFMLQPEQTFEQILAAWCFFYSQSLSQIPRRAFATSLSTRAKKSDGTAEAVAL